ncbi:hypothetical protein [Streptomyces sp. NPDC091212]|uniref:hypothetical protein n=1 Tax=Streptomyces sp. NPDC091212 TaxID=3155191 RepID=UPI00341FB4E2
MITVSPSLEDGEIGSCHVSVDGSLAPYIKDARSSGAIDAMEFAMQPHRQLKNPERMKTGKDGDLADNGTYIVDPRVFEGKKINYIL